MNSFPTPIARSVSKQVVLLVGLVCVHAATAAEPFQSYELDVIPGNWISSGIEHEAVPNDSIEAAVAFPSLLNPDAESSDIVFQSSVFFGINNQFPTEGTFVWPQKLQPLVSITIQRFPPTGQSASFVIRAADETEIRKLQWKEFQDLQKQFRQWLIRKSGCWFFTDPSERFINLESTLRSFWKDKVLAGASFKGFANNYLNVPVEFTVNYSGSDGNIRNQISSDPHFTEMTAIPVAANEQLRISWGTTAVYPHGQFGIVGGVSRTAIGGQTDIQITSQLPGLSLYPPGTAKTQSIYSTGTTGLDDSKHYAPFPAAMGSLFGRLFVPIFTVFDLHDLCLITPYPCGATSPKYLFLLTPSEYVKPEADNGLPANVVQFASDARTDAALTDFAGQLTRRTILIGLDEWDERNPSCAVSKELSRLVDTAINKTMFPNDHHYTAGVFANDTAVEVRRHISIDGRILELTQPRLSRWSDVVATYMPWILVQPIENGLPSLVIQTLKPAAATHQKRKLTIRVYSVEDDVLNSARISEGDEYHARPNL